MQKSRQLLATRSFAFLLLILIGLMLLHGCSSSSSNNPMPLAISTSSLPNGQVGAAYSATLVATGGTPPYTWTTTSGALPAGMMLTASTGAISGTPTVSVTNSALTFQVKDSSSPVQSKTADLTLTIAPAPGVSVSISPRRGGAAISQLLPLIATVANDVGSAGVSWSVSTGGVLSGKSTTKASFSSATAAVYTVTATSNADNSKSATITIGVTDLAGVTTYHNNLSRNGTNVQEYALTTANVTVSSFGKLFTCPVDGAIYAQPLWMPNLAIVGGTHNVVFVATTHDSVYAFDADISPCVTYWRKILLGAGETFVDFNDVNTGDIQPDIGIIGTPVIDLSSKTLYVVSKSEDTGTSCIPSSACHQRLHGLSLIDGSEKFGGPATIDASITVPGTGDGSSGGALPFNPLTENQRPGLALVNGVVYVSWASHGDNDPYHGWVMGFTAGNLAIAPVVWNSTPNSVAGFPQSRGGIWMSGGAPAADSSNNLYFLTGNGSFDADSGGSNYGDSTVKLSTTSGLSVTGYFTPEDQSSLNSNDTDHGSGGAAILIDQPSGPVQHLMIGGGKAAILFLVNRDNLGSFDPAANHVVQALNIGQPIFATSAFWNNNLYIAGRDAALQQFTFNTTSGLFGLSPTHSSPGSFGFPGATPSVSSTGVSTNGIVWALDNHSYCTEQSPPPCGPAVLHAYDATNVGTELWNSSQASGNRDRAGNAVKFTVPTVANGKVYVGTRGNNTGGASNTTSVPGELDVYGLLP
jgi:hypothetical protein